MEKQAWSRFQATCEKCSSCFIFHLSTNYFVDKLEKNVNDKSKEEEVFPEDDRSRHDHLTLQLNEVDCKLKTTNFNLMARAQSLEKERDKALKEVEVKNEVIKCLEEKTVEDALVLDSLISDFANNLFFFLRKRSKARKRNWQS